MGSIIIREATIRDADGISILEQVSFARPWSKESIEKDLTGNPRAMYFVADQDSIIAGYIGLWVVEGEGHINNIAVLPGYRRRGIAGSLIRHMLTVTEAMDVKSHTLEVRESNQAAINLYEKFDFVTSGRRRGYYEESGEDALIMWRIGRQNDEMDGACGRILS